MAPSFQIALFLYLASWLLVAEACCEEKKKPCCPVCPPGWTQLGYRCFFLQVRPKPWYQAERDCIAIDGNLASIHSAEEQNALRAYMSSSGYGFRHAWIGLTDAVQEGIYFWSDGTQFDYQNWRAGVPKNLRNEDCVVTNFGDLPCCDDHHCNPH